ncbi:MAG: DEAD/DEAH box helicase [Actinobacteria bacterium]|nr:DEAD/DEAH box helicase [Actinomycetota bacterium]
MTTFKELGLSTELLDALDKVGYTDPTPIQQQAIPSLLGGADVIGQAQTGTGKTAAFGLPMLQSIDPGVPEVQGLVLTPTRELCIQVAQSLRAYGAARGIDVLATFGGAPIRQQMDRLKAGPQVVVGTVGRVLDLHGRHSLMFHDARFVVLDEADEMLDLGFLEDVELILKKCPNGRQTALFSATMPPAIAKLAERHLHDPVTIKVKAPTLTIDTVDHFQMPVKRSDKIDTLIEVIDAERPRQALVFVRTKIGVDRLAKDLDRRKPGLRVRALHGDMSQGSRDGVMISFKEGRVPVLVATDIAARGLDVENVTHVINYDLPNSAEIYTHRIGRTGRAGRGGTAITLVESKDREDMAGIEKHINVEIPDWSADAKRRAGKVGATGAAAAGSGGEAPSESSGDGESGSGRGGGRGSSSRGGSGSGDTERGERTPRTRRPRTRPEAAEISEEAVASEAETVADDGAEAIAVETAIESGINEEQAPDEIEAVEAEAVESDAVAADAAESESVEDETVKADSVETESAEDESSDGDAATDDADDEDGEPGEPETITEESADEAETEPIELRHPRHIKPSQDNVNDDDEYSLLIVGAGAAAGVEPADVIELIRSAAGLSGEEVRRVRVLARFTLARVPNEKAHAVATSIDGGLLRGATVSAEAVNGGP